MSRYGPSIELISPRLRPIKNSSKKWAPAILTHRHMTAFNTLPDKNLTKDQEAVLSRRIHNGPGKQDALDRLVVNNLKEASIYAKHYCSKDLFSDGEIMSLCYFFFLKIRPPPRSTLFPYTTLFR